jgi:hypothetical protein
MCCCWPPLSLLQCFVTCLPSCPALADTCTRVGSSASFADFFIGQKHYDHGTWGGISRVSNTQPTRMRKMERKRFRVKKKFLILHRTWFLTGWSSVDLLTLAVLAFRPLFNTKFRFVFCDVLPCKLIVDRRFRGTCCLHHRGWFYTAIHPRKQIWTSYSPPWELDISYCLICLQYVIHTSLRLSTTGNEACQ